MREEKVQVLKRLQNDEITAVEAAKLLEGLDNPQALEVTEVKEEKPSGNLGKTFRIKILSSDGDRVNVQIPLNFAKLALRHGGRFLKDKVQSDIDLDFEEVLEMIDKGNIGKLVDIVSADGDSVEIVID